MEKLSAPPREERAANAKKAETDRLAADLMGLDQKKLKDMAVDMAYLFRQPKNPKILLCGGAGSGKSTLATALSNRLGIPYFDFDEYIPGGWTDDEKEYSRRFMKGLQNLWADLPSGKGYIVEHVEACNPDMVLTVRPTHAVLLDPGDDRLRRAAEARNMVGTPDKTRESRALTSAARARGQFSVLKAEGGVRSHGFEVKKLTEG